MDYDISGLYTDFQRELSAKGWWFDTSTISPEDTAQKIIAEAAGERSSRGIGHRSANGTVRTSS
jgi:hypothetical protein